MMVFDPSKDVQKPQEKLNLDKILKEEIGEFGWFQLRILSVCALVMIFSAFSANHFNFTTARINTRCLIPECDPAEPEFAPPWIEYAVPDGCHRYGNTSIPIVTDTCLPEHFDRNITLPCDKYVYEKTDTVVYDFDLACDEWSRTFIGSARSLGSFISLPIIAYISDRWGRRSVLLFCAVNRAWLGTVRYWVNNYVGYIISEVVESSIGSRTTAYLLAMELMGPKYRVAAGAIMQSFASIGSVIMTVIAWVVPDWRTLTLALYLPQFISIFYFWLITESVRWYISKERYSESEALLRKIARINKKTLSPESLDALRRTAEEQNKRKKVEEQQKSEWLIVLVFRHKNILLRCLIVPVWWISTKFVKFSMSVNAVYISGNRYLNYMLVSVVGIPGYLTAVYLSNKFGRKPILIGSYWICAICQIAYIFTPDNMYGLSLTIYLFGKYSIATVNTVMHLYTVELYPTKHRHSLYAFSSNVGKIGYILAPLTPAFGAATFEQLPFVLFAGLALLAGALVFLTPETLGTKLPDTMEEAENMDKK